MKTNNSEAEAEHTPGPWDFGSPAEKRHEVFDEARRTLAVVRDYPDGIANARLIACAPEMLEALYMALPYVEEGEMFNKPIAQHFGKRIRALIGRAEGKA
jgi:hypothetical protein